MTKNSTRKGLALGAIAAMLVSGFTSAPAYANGIDNGFVSLAPLTGTEYTVIAGAGNSFKLTANNASTLTVGNLKFLVTDPSGDVEVGLSTSGRIGGSLTTSATVGATGVSASAEALSISNNAAHSIDAGSRVAFSGGFTFSSNAVAATEILTVSSANKANGKLVLARTGTASATAVTVSENVQIRVLREPRNAAGTAYIVDTGTRTSDSTLELVAPSGDTREVTVQAWVDTNLNNLIDTTEYISPARTVKFIKASELEVATSLSVVPGDAFLTAKVTTTPVLNGTQALANNSNFLNVGFTRQDATNTGDVFAPAAVGWNNTAKEFSATISLTVGSSVGKSSTSDAVGTTNTAWTIDNTIEPALADAKATVASGSKTVTVTLAAGQNPHGLRSGDFVTFRSNTLQTVATAKLKVNSVLASNSFTVVSSTASSTSVAAPGVDAGYTVDTYGSNVSITDRAFAGTYTARAYINRVAAGTRATAEAVAATSAAIEYKTVGSASVQGTDAETSAAVKKGTLTVPVTVSVLDADEAAVTAGRLVVVTFSSSVTGVKVNDKTSATTQNLVTDANGQVLLTVTSPLGSLGSVTISATAENGPQASFTLNWADQAYSLVDLADTDSSIDTTRAIVAGGSYTVDLAVMDQWFAVAPSAEYRLVVTGSGVVEGVKTLTDGKSSLTITDNGFESAMSTTVNLQKATSGVWGTVDRVVMTTNINKNTNSVVLGANNSALYAGVTAKLSGAVALKAIEAQDRRLTTATQPKYSTSAVVVSGKIQNAATSAGVRGAAVTLTGPTSVLFSKGSVDKIGSITVIADTNGEFSVQLFSTVAQKDTVITVASLGKSATTKVTFTGETSTGVGAKLEITAPASVAPASTLQVKAKLTDTFNNPVAAAVKVSYTGPGITFGALPTATDKDGELMFSALLGGGDTGNVVVTISYDQNGDGDYADAKDIVVSKTIAIVTPAAPAAPEVNAVIGSFNNRVAVRVENAKGSVVSVKIGARWFKYTSLNDNYLFTVRSVKGRTVAVAVYVNGTLENVQTITVK